MGTVDVIDRGIKCLSDNLGEKETEIFISTLLKERFDYTEWRKRYFSDVKTAKGLEKFTETIGEGDTPTNAKVIL